MDDPLVDSHNAEALNAVAVAEEAKQKAQAAQMHTVVTSALQEVLTQGDEGTKRLLIQKIPLLCSDILKIKGDLVWIKWFIMGIAGGIGLLVIEILANGLK